ncbi:hypothetical protein XENTR_v10016078 [Xenopus tropicalis]|nr:hypothetical protein XENTR_v10016078 [Xenopus tropicalis]KAE8596379.1 hypothetical protein XENTR_v10016078 [Xenopus tropicalis]
MSHNPLPACHFLDTELAHGHCPFSPLGTSPAHLVQMNTAPIILHICCVSQSILGETYLPSRVFFSHWVTGANLTDSNGIRMKEIDPDKDSG